MYDFYKTLGVPGNLGHYCEVVEALECLSGLEIFLYDFYKTLGVNGDLGVSVSLCEYLSESFCVSLNLSESI